MEDHSNLWIILTAGLATATVVFLLLMFFSARTAPKRPLNKTSFDAPWFRFDKNKCTSASKAALEIIDVQTSDNLPWAKVRSFLAPRFADLPETLPDDHSPATRDAFHSRFPDDSAMVHLEGEGQHILISLEDPAPISFADKHLSFLRRRDIDLRDDAMNKLEHPMWAKRNGRIFWTNRAYRALEKERRKATEDTSEIFDPAILKAPGETTARVSLTVGFGHGEVHWFDISSVQVSTDTVLHFAFNVDGLIAAETTQRKFVQTLAKTFAQLSTGLAIFDRDRRLVLFNPALVDLTSLPAHFLSGQPNIQAFFDRLRDNRIMPEPKDYSSWRRQIADLVVQSADGRYQEIWRLPNGVTYRIVGRPHPDGAIAILIEDISVEMSLTKRFKGQVELRDTALQAQRDAVVCFESDGSIAFWNRAFLDFIGLPQGSSAKDYTLPSIMRLWKDRLSPGTVRNTLSARLRTGSEQEGSFTLADGRELGFELRVHDGNATVITLRCSQLPDTAPTPAKSPSPIA
jgi:PAS domain-containing protein